jgi:hypothetical protein
MPGGGPLQVPPPVGGGEAHALGPGAPKLPVDREVFSSNEFFSITTSRSISNTTSFTLLSYFALPLLLLSPLLRAKGFSKKKENHPS